MEEVDLIAFICTLHFSWNVVSKMDKQTRRSKGSCLLCGGVGIFTNVEYMNIQENTKKKSYLSLCFELYLLYIPLLLFLMFTNLLGDEKLFWVMTTNT